LEEKKLNAEIEANKLKTIVEEDDKYCTRCRKNKSASDYVGTTLVVNDNDEYVKASVQYKTCGVCRLRDKGRIWSR
jgi:RNA polymerase subunit RPABC4/transcription elongation factor Spt4